MAIGMYRTKRKPLPKLSIAIALSLIIIGWFTANPAFNILQRNQAYAYLYPQKANNPVSANGTFWLESNPKLGAYPLSVWGKVLANQTKVIVIPEDHGYVSATGLDSIGQKVGGWITHKLKNSGQGKYSDPFTYKRTVGDVTEEIRVPKDVIDKHFKNNDAFGKFIDQVKNGLTNDDIIKETNKQNGVDEVLGQLKKALEQGEGTEAKMAKTTGNSLMVGGAILILFKLLPLLAL